MLLTLFVLPGSLVPIQKGKHPLVILSVVFVGW